MSEFIKVGFMTFKDGRKSVMDLEDLERLGTKKWHICKSGYVFRNYRIGTNNKKVLLARAIMGHPEGMQVDHINKDKLDNRKSNLRIVTHQENSWGRKHKNRSSPFIGVCIRANGKWHAQSSELDGKRVSLGCHNSEIDAAIAYDLFAISQRGLMAKTNVLPPMPQESKVVVTPLLRKRRYSLRAYCLEHGLKYHQALSNPGVILQMSGATHAKRLSKRSAP